MTTKEEIDQYARERGYELHSKSGDGLIRSYSKQFDKFFLSLTVALHDKAKCMKLSGFPGMFELHTGNMQLMHPRFTSFFEQRMVQMMSAIENENEALSL